VSDIRALLQPIADFFAGFNLPEPIIHWGHPLMMGIVVFAMGTAVGLTGWRSRTLTDGNEAQKNRGEHRKIAPLMFAFMAMGYTGGVLSLVMQQESIFESPHFWTGSLVLVLLAANGMIAFFSFGKNKIVLRTVHAYLGSTALCVMFLHAVLGLKLGLSI